MVEEKERNSQQEGPNDSPAQIATPDEPQRPDLTGVMKPFTRGRNQEESETKSAKE